MAFSFRHGEHDPTQHEEKPGIGCLGKSVGGGERPRLPWVHSTPIPAGRQAGKPARRVGVQRRETGTLWQIFSRSNTLSTIRCGASPVSAQEVFASGRRPEVECSMPMRTSPTFSPSDYSKVPAGSDRQDPRYTKHADISPPAADGANPALRGLRSGDQPPGRAVRPPHGLWSCGTVQTALSIAVFPAWSVAVSDRSYLRPLAE